MNTDFKKCLVQGCESNAHRSVNGKRGWCSKHYQRWKRWGDPNTYGMWRSTAQDWVKEHLHHEGEECLIWPFHRGKDGYGRMHDPSRGSVLTTASRYILEQAAGPPPSPRHECAHSCGKGNLGCVNPKHLRWATPTENQGERVDHGTSNRGERQGRSKLTRADVLEIRKLINKESQTKIAARFGISQTTVNNIKSGKRWGWL